ncbi:MAG: 1-(5-phosphoribosyl)-5-[(5-phosphoribosylamino)methylideneamino]imidazole-4-carboxamide isomerase [Actinobacteria bacterium]|nr:1-(5-phosphoribosyl)-5-[(5-phosphoribosylamino)methylideneamino]imidazole-4-carboxamide isomerase [Actinomycetota bacterium]
MEIIPAIDIIDGACVRLLKGNYDKKTKYSDNPIEVAKKWVSCGAKWIHLVDLDGAREGKPKNLNIALKIKQKFKVRIEYGGGIRDTDSLKSALKAGIDRIIIGTRAIENLNDLMNFYDISKGKIIVSLDFGEDCRILTKGWLSDSQLSLFDFGSKLKSLGFSEIIITDISRDGTLEGINIDIIRNFLDETGLGVYVAGGVADINDIKKLKELEKNGVRGVIIGKALYEGKIDLKEAIKTGKDDYKKNNTMP